MRLIGHLSSEASATRFNDFLCLNGIASEIEREQEGWAVWIHSEDELARAREWLEQFHVHPQDSLFHSDPAKIQAMREREAATVSEAGRRHFDRSEVFREDVGWLTVALVVVCLGITGAAWAGYRGRIHEWLFLTRITEDGNYIRYLPGLMEIRHGEWWRLFTPALVHLQVMHLVFNMMGLYFFGNFLEARLGPLRLATLVVLLAVVSNLAQYYFAGPNFCGFSGVLYGLFGYAWIRGRFDAESGLEVNQQTVIVMLVWFALCFTGLLGPIANGAHASGLALGAGWGFAAAKFNQSRRRN